MSIERVACANCEGSGVVPQWNLGAVDDHRTCPNCRGEGDVPDPVEEANRAISALHCGGTLTPSAALRILGNLVAEVEALRRHNGPENNDE